MPRTLASVAERAEHFADSSRLNGNKTRTDRQRRADLFARMHRCGVVLGLAKGLTRPMEIAEFKAVLDAAWEKYPGATRRTIRYLNRQRRSHGPLIVPWRTMKLLRTGKMPGIDIDAEGISQLRKLKDQANHSERRARA